MTRRERRPRKGRESGSSRVSAPGEGPDPRLRLQPLHAALIGGGVLVAILGYWFLARDSITAAPILLLLAYLLLIPIGLALPSRKRTSGPNTGEGKGG
jgi:hypothetical protein